MKKIETIWHAILHSAVAEKKYRHTQKEIAEKYGFSLSTVHHALAVPEQLGAIRKEGKFFVLAAFRKLLYYWASVRQLERDIFHRATVHQPIQEIEGLALPGTLFAGYSAARFHLSEPPADYAKVYWYAKPELLERIRDRFPPPKKSREPANVFFLKEAEAMKNYGPVTTLVQTFVDIWNLADWYSADFTKALEEKVNGLLS